MNSVIHHIPNLCPSMTLVLWMLVALMPFSPATGQTEELNAFPEKGSYLFYGQPAFEDNSFLLEEAINQEKGVMQYVSNFYFDNIHGGDIIYSFSHDIPLSGLRHQVNYTLVYHFQQASPTRDQNSGFGDISVGYHFMLSGKKDWAMVVPGVTLILPTGKSFPGRGMGGVGAQLSLAITKRISHKLVTHYNVGYTFISDADGYVSTLTGTPVLAYEKDLQHANFGAGIVWYPARKVILFTEYSSNFVSQIRDDGSVLQTHFSSVNPGFRIAIDHHNVQIVPGISVPMVFSGGMFSRTGLFFYLSFETEYLPFTKSKHR